MGIDNSRNSRTPAEQSDIHFDHIINLVSRVLLAYTLAVFNQSINQSVSLFVKTHKLYNTKKQSSKYICSATGSAQGAIIALLIQATHVLKRYTVCCTKANKKDRCMMMKMMAMMMIYSYVKCS